MVEKTKKQVPLNTYLWTGVDKNKRDADGEVEAQNLQRAKLLLQRQGVRIKKIRKQPKARSGFGNKVKVKDIVFMTRQLATMIDAGIPLAQSIKGIAAGHEKSSVKKLLDSIRMDVESGTNLSASLKKHPAHFNRLYTSMISVGEESGTLDAIMDKVAVYLEKTEALKAKVRAAMFYPSLVITVAFVIVAILLIVVIPEFESLFSDYGAELPTLTRWVVGLSNSVQQYWVYWIVALALTVTVIIFAYQRSPQLRHSVDYLALRIPVIGPVIRKAAVARVSRTLATMFSAGIPLVEALKTVATAAGNRIYADGLRAVRHDVTGGRSLAGSMTETGLFNGMVLQMVTTGEESGKLETMLNKIAEFYETEVDNTVAVISTLIEPFLIVILGVIVGTIVIAMYLPIFKLGAVF